MVTGGNEADVIFPGAVEGLFGGFTGQVQIDAGQHRLVNVTLTATGAPTHPTNHLAAFDQQRLTAHDFLHPAREIPRGHRFVQ
ncbi:hypothetical protein D3C72_2477970 [compost metagenome]